jgi:peptidyl-tRNA hydrolase
MTAAPEAPGDAGRGEPLKMWLVVRTDVAMSAMKLAAQAMHAVQWMTMSLVTSDPGRLAAYFESVVTLDAQPSSGSPKIVVAAKNLHALTRALSEARAAGIPALCVTDEGRTEFPGPTTAVVLFGPARESELPKYLGNLQFLKSLKPLAA